MYNALIQWIGSTTCNVAGDLTSLVDAGSACSSGQALNVGMIVIAVVAFAFVVMVIGARRRKRRDFY